VAVRPNKKSLAYRVLKSVWRQGFKGLTLNPFIHFAPPGHFYSPIPDPEFIAQRRGRLFERQCTTIPGVALNTAGQLALLDAFVPFYSELPFTPQQSSRRRYYFDNSFFGYSDAIVLYSMLRHFRPRRVIEVGSGFSSALMLDTNDLFFSSGISFTFIEPHAQRLTSLMRPEDHVRQRVVTSMVQDVPETLFDSLEANDILFVDSSHVVKVGSDVVHLLTHVLPRLNKGVLVHFHDVFWPFEYPEEWFADGRAWNENYVLKAFLQFNDSFEILLFSSYLATHHRRDLETHIPLALRNPGGSLWIRRTAVP
jgi:predicted O-methyltransferase YrrM